MALERKPFFDDVEYPNAFGHEDEYGDNHFVTVRLNRVVFKLYSFDGDLVAYVNGAERFIRGARLPQDVMERQSESRGDFLERFTRESGEAAIIPDVVARELKKFIADPSAYDLFIFRLKESGALLERIDGARLPVINNDQLRLRRPKNWEAAALVDESRVP